MRQMANQLALGLVAPSFCLISPRMRASVSLPYGARYPRKFHHRRLAQGEALRAVELQCLGTAELCPAPAPPIRQVPHTCRFWHVCAPAVDSAGRVHHDKTRRDVPVPMIRIGMRQPRACESLTYLSRRWIIPL